MQRLTQVSQTRPISQDKPPNKSAKPPNKSGMTVFCPKKSMVYGEVEQEAEGR
jgi:hypothetical protein